MAKRRIRPILSGDSNDSAASDESAGRFFDDERPNPAPDQRVMVEQAGGGAMRPRIFFSRSVPEFDQATGNDSGDSPDAQAVSDVSAEPSQDSGSEEDGSANDAPKIDESIAEEAASYGFSRDEIESYASDPDSLRRMMRAIDRRLMSANAAATGSQPLSSFFQQTAQRQSSAEEPGTTNETAIGRPMVFEKFKLNLSADEHGDQLVKSLNDMNDHYAKMAELQASAYEKKIESIAKTIQAVAMQEPLREFHQAVISLGDDYVSVYGKVPFTKLPPGHANRVAQEKLLATSIGLEQAYTRAGIVPPGIDVLVARAAAFENPDVYERRIKAKAGLSDKNRGRAVSRPAPSSPRPASSASSARNAPRFIAPKLAVRSE